MAAVLLFGPQPRVRAEPPALLQAAVRQWTDHRQELAFTQKTRLFFADGRLKVERVERYDPSLPDDQRWRLIEVDGRPATAEERQKWETKKNHRRHRFERDPAELVDFDHAVLVEDGVNRASYEIRMRPSAARLLGIEKLSAIVTVDKGTESVVRITSTLHEPIRVLMGLARITDLDVDLQIEPWTEGPTERVDGAELGGGRVEMSRLGSYIEYSWSDFKRVTEYPE